jgi:2-methylcitrate dehydratase PrpD
MESAQSKTTEIFCRNLSALTSASLTTAAFDAARRLVLDGLAIAVAGSREQAPRILSEHLRELGGAEQSTAIGFGFKTSTVFAAYLNGASMHVLDYEPMWNPPNHATSTTLPAVLALAEIVPASGAEIVTALIKGVEAQGRLRVASLQYAPKDVVFHPPGVVGVIGSAISAAHMLKLDLDRTRNAVGIAASRSGTLLANAGTMTKCTHCGLAAAMGLDAALLAQRGFTANADIIETPNGYASAFFGSQFDPDALTRTGAALHIVEPGYAIKMFPSQYATHFAIAAALDVRRRIPGPETVRSMEIRAPVVPYVDRPYPATGLEGKFSFQYAAACALLDGAVGVGSFSDQRRFQPDMEGLLGKIRLVQSPDIPPTMDRMFVEIRVELANGERVSATCKGPKGIWGNPVPAEEHLKKVRDCLRTRLDEAAIERCVAMVDRFEGLESAEVRSLLHILGGFASVAS